MHHLVTIAVGMMALAAPDANEFILKDSNVAEGAHGAKASKIVPTKTDAAMKFFVIDKDKGPVKGVVICLTSPVGAKYYTEETDDAGYAEVLVPVGRKYDVTYLSLGRGDIATAVTVTDEPKQNIKLTLRYKQRPPLPPFVLTGVNFDTGKATIRPESLVRLDIVVEFMKYKKSAHIEISGHTDKVGNPRANQVLSAKRAQACRAYLISKGIAGSRITAVGYGDARPVAANDTDREPTEEPTNRGGGVATWFGRREGRYSCPARQALTRSITQSGASSGRSWPAVGVLLERAAHRRASAREQRGVDQPIAAGRPAPASAARLRAAGRRKRRPRSTGGRRWPGAPGAAGPGPPTAGRRRPPGRAAGW